MNTIVDRSLNVALNFTLQYTGVALGMAVTRVAARVLFDFCAKQSLIGGTYNLTRMNIFGGTAGLVLYSVPFLMVITSRWSPLKMALLQFFSNLPLMTRINLPWKNFHFEVINAFAFGHLFTEMVMKHDLTRKVREIAPQRVKLTLGAVGAVITTAVASFFIRTFAGSYAPWGRKGLLIQTVMVVAAGLLYTRLDRLLTCEELRSNSFELRGSTVGKILSTNTKSGSFEKQQLQIRSNVEFVLDHLANREISHEFTNPLKRTMIFQNSFYYVNFKNKKQNYDTPLAGLPQEMIQYISQWLLPGDIARVGRTCQTLYIRIYGPKGAPIWSNKNLGSIGSVQYFYLLAAEIAAAQDKIEDKTRTRFLQYALIYPLSEELLFHPSWRGFDAPGSFSHFLTGVTMRWRKYHILAASDLKVLQNLEPRKVARLFDADLKEYISNQPK